MTNCISIAVDNKPLAFATIADKPLAYLSVYNCGISPQSQPMMSTSFSLTDHHRNEDQLISLTISAANPTPTTDISNVQALLQVWDYSNGIKALCFEKNNGNGITIIEATATQVTLEAHIEPADYTNMTPQLPDRDVKLEVIVWLTIDAKTKVYAKGHFVSRTPLAKV